MQIYLPFSEGWYACIAFFLFIWSSIIIYRKSYKNKREIKQQIIFSILIVVTAFVNEVIGVSFGLWNYVPVNWPVVLWLTYFAAALAAYQTLKLMMEKGI